MKPSWRLASLVTLTLICGFPLYSAETAELRSWTDVQGRTIQAKLLSVDLTAETVRIQRADGVEFELPLIRFCPEDRAYARAQVPAEPANTDGLKELTAENWEWLTRSGSMQASRYNKVPAKEMAAILNTRLANAKLTEEKGALTGLRLDENCGITVVSAEVRNTVSYATFLRELAKANNLHFLVDASRNIVVRSAGASVLGTPAAGDDKIDFLGVGI